MKSSQILTNQKKNNSRRKENKKIYKKLKEKKLNQILKELCQHCSQKFSN